MTFILAEQARLARKQPPGQPTAWLAHCQQRRRRQRGAQRRRG